MRIELDYTKSPEQNAATYFEKAKSLKKKILGAEKAILKAHADLAKIEAKKEEQEQATTRTRRHKEWYEKFRWFITSSGFLVIGGRDATTNDIIVKKHTDAHDVVFHTDMAGSPFFIVKTEGKPVDSESLGEVADATCSFSRAFKLGLSASDVFYVKPEQLTKTPRAGEYLGKGAFVVHGKTNYLPNEINVSIGALPDGRIMCGPLNAVKKHCAKYLIIKQGSTKPSDIAKKIKKELGGELDEIIRLLPSGTMKIVQRS